MTFSEADLYEPIRQFLENAGYQVQAEVKNCDIAAKKEDTLLIVELKKSFGLKLVYQAIERQTLTEEVYVAIPRPEKGQKEKSWQNMLRLLRRLHLGLLTVALDSPLQTVDVILTPQSNDARKNKAKRCGLETELQNRQVQANVGGITRKKIITAYREKALTLCCILEHCPSASYAQLRNLGLEEKYLAILRSNVYHWFTRIQPGVYTLSEEGKAALLLPEYQTVIRYYQEQYQNWYITTEGETHGNE